MIDINLLRTNPDLVRENIRKKFQDAKLPLVDEVLDFDKKNREAIQRADYLRSQRNKISKQIGMLMGQGKKDEAEAAKQQVKDMQDELQDIEQKEELYAEEIRKRMLVIPNIIDASVPIGKDDSQNVENERFGEPVVPEWEVPYHVDIMERLNGIDLDAARRTSGNGFYYLKGDIARLHSAILSYARDFMIDHGFTYYVPPFMIHGNVVTGVMSFAEMENMMYKIEGEDLYLIGTSEHSMIGKFIDQMLDESELPQTLTSYSPCFRKEVGAHGIEERGVYRIHQFEKQEMVVVCKPEESMDWYNKMWKLTVDFFRSMDIPVRTLASRSSPATWRPGPPASRSTSRWAPAPTWATPRPAGSRSASRARTARRSTCPTPSTTPWWPRPACSSPSWRTTSSPTAPSASPNPFGCTWAERPRFGDGEAIGIRHWA